jgi:hypothetical protein
LFVIKRKFFHRLTLGSITPKLWIMKKFYFLILLSIGLSSCHRKEFAKCDSLKSYIYSDATEEEVYTLKLTCNDTVFLTEYLPNQKSFFAINKTKHKIKIDSLVDNIDFSNLEESYSETSLQDRHAFKLLIQNGKKLDSVFVYGKKAPTNIYKISAEFRKIIKSLKFSPYTKDIDYGKHIIRFPPPPPPPSDKETVNQTIFKTWN